MVRPITGTGNRSLNSTVVNCRGNICECLAEKIDELLNNVTTHANGTKGLKQLAQEQTQRGASGPGTSVWNVHAEKFEMQQDNLRDHLDEYDAQNCGGGGGPPVPAEARRWSVRSAPSAAEWNANNAYQGLTGSAAGDVAAGVGTVGAGYLLYRGVRLIPSLFPPLWPTLGPNLAIP